MIVTYYTRDLGGEVAAVYRIVHDPQTSITRGFVANRRSAGWAEKSSVAARASGAGGASDYDLVDRKIALEHLRAWGVSSDDLDDGPHSVAR